MLISFPALAVSSAAADEDALPSIKLCLSITCKSCSLHLTCSTNPRVRLGW
jgi:hypothetical protein